MTTPPFVLERGKQQYREVYDIIHPRQQMARPRKLRLSPFYRRQVELGAGFVVGAELGASRSGAEMNGARPRRRPPGSSATRGRRGSGRRSRRRAHLATRARRRHLPHPMAIREVRRAGSGRHSRSSSACSRTGSTGPRDDRLHAGAHGARRHPPRPHDHAQGRRAVPRGDRRRGGQHDIAWLRRHLRDGERVTIASGRGRCSRSTCGGRTRGRSSRP